MTTSDSTTSSTSTQRPLSAREQAIKTIAAETYKLLTATHNSHISGNLAEDKDGNNLPPDSNQACKFCAVGALLKVTKKPELDDYYNTFLYELKTRLDIHSALTSFNDASESNRIKIRKVLKELAEL